MDEKKSVKKFRRKYKIDKISSDTLSLAVEKMGYTIIYFRLFNNKEKVDFLIKALDVENYVCSCKCFAYQDEKYRLLFINEDLSEEEKLIVLGHEVGHIWHNHMQMGAVFGNDVMLEHQANEFSHYLLLLELVGSYEYILESKCSFKIIFFNY